MGSISKTKAIDIITDAAINREREIGRELTYAVSHNAAMDSRLVKYTKMLESGSFGLFSFFSQVDFRLQMKILDHLRIGDFYDDIQKYISFCMRSSFKVLKEVSAEAWETAQFANGKEEMHWHIFWKRSTEKVKLELLDYITYSIDGIKKRKGEELGLMLNKSDMLHNQMKQILLKEGLTTPDLSLLSPGDKAEWNALYEQSKEVSEGICKLVNG